MLWDKEECRDLWDEIGVEKERPFDSFLLLNVPDKYGLFLEILGLRYFWVKGIAFFCFCARLESVWEYLRFARRFIQFENGRRRAWRSCVRLVLGAQEVNQWVSHLVLTHHLIATDRQWTPYLCCVKVETFTCSWQTALFHKDRDGGTETQCRRSASQIYRFTEKERSRDRFYVEYVSFRNRRFDVGRHKQGEKNVYCYLVWNQKMITS